MIDNFDIYNLKENIIEDNTEIISGLENTEQKKINSKHFYDEEGSKLFDKITELPEYYPTRTEIEILEKKTRTFQKKLPSDAVIIEFGSGSNKKIKKLLKALKNPKEYISIDISYDFLILNAKEIAKNFPQINVKAVCADFYQINELSKLFKYEEQQKIGFFPGSTIGNFVREDAKKLLKNFASILGKNNYLIIGIDLRKNINVMEKAYNDSKGITAKFNKNILTGINKRIGTNFNVENFDHKAYFNEEKKRIEMYLISKVNQNFSIKDKKIILQKGESIHTENSHKYSIDEFKTLTHSCGFKTIDFLSDEKNYFGIFFLRVF